MWGSAVTDAEEDLREALLELRARQGRDAVARRSAGAVLEALEAMSGAPSPVAAMAQLLGSIRRSFDCDAVAVVTMRAAGPRLEARVSRHTPAGAGADPARDLGGGKASELGAQIGALSSGGARRFVDADHSQAAALFAAIAPGSCSAISAPLALGAARAPAALMCLDARFAAFAPEDARVLSRIASLASQALEALALSERNALLAAVIEDASVSMAIVDATQDELPLIYVNNAFETLTGYARHEVIGRNCRFLSCEAPRSPERARLRQAVAERRFGRFELRNRRRDGSCFWNDLTLYPVKAGGDAAPVKYLVATQVDATARHVIETERDEAQRRLVSALSATREGILLLGPRGETLLANDRFRDLFGDATTEWRAGSAAADAFERGARLADPSLTAALWRGMAAGALEDHEILLADGRSALVNARPTPLDGIVIVVSDITKIKQAERQLSDRAVAMDAAQDGIAITDAQGDFVYMNQSHLRLFGYDRLEEVIGRHWSMLYDESGAAQVEALAMPELGRAGVWRGEVLGLRRDGALFPQEVTLTLLGQTGLICVTRDVSERRRAERDRERFRDQLAEAQRHEAVGQLAAGIAHDFNNLLSAMSVSAALVRDDLLAGGRDVAHVDRIIRASEMAAELVTRLLRQARGTDRRPEPIDLRAPFNDALELLRASTPAQIDLVASAPSAPVLARLDATEFSQVLLNLAINARDAVGSEPGRVELRLGRVEAAAIDHAAFYVGDLRAAASYVVLEVRDTGHGFAPASAPQFFEPFVTSKGAAGTGLGLSVVSGLMKKAGGAVAVASAIGSGACFRVFWPACDAPGCDCSGAADAGAAAEASAPRRHATSDLPQGLDGVAILLVDDDAIVADALGAVLERAGAEIVVATDPRDAAEALRDDPDAFSLLITDFDMPHLDGAALARLSRALNPRRPILLLTALADVQARPGVAARVFDAVLSKPIAPQALVGAIAKLLDAPGAPPLEQGTTPC